MDGSAAKLHMSPPSAAGWAFAAGACDTLAALNMAFKSSKSSTGSAAGFAGDAEALLSFEEDLPFFFSLWDLLVAT